MDQHGLFGLVCPNAADAAALSAPGTLLCVHTMILAAYLIYEAAYQHLYSNLISTPHPWLNLLTLSFGYHIAPLHRASLARSRLRVLDRCRYGEASPALMLPRKLLRTSNRSVHCVFAQDSEGPGRTDKYVGVHGVSLPTGV